MRTVRELTDTFVGFRVWLEKVLVAGKFIPTEGEVSRLLLDVDYEGPEVAWAASLCERIYEAAALDAALDDNLDHPSVECSRSGTSALVASLLLDAVIDCEGIRYRIRAGTYRWDAEYDLTKVMLSV